MVKVAEKLDWLEFAVLYTKNYGLIRKEVDDIDEIEVHNLKFGDRLIAAFLRDPGYDENESKELIKKFCQYVIPDEWHKYFNFNECNLEPNSVRGYAFTMRVGDPERNFFIRIPMKEVSDYEVEHNFYCVENARNGYLMCYNALVGYKIVISGSNIPTERIKLHDDIANGTIYPIRYDVENWVIKLQKYNTNVKLTRVDCALDLGIDFNYFAKLWQTDPRQFKVPYLKENCRLDYNPYFGNGAICCGKRGSANDSYLRIYNKAAEQKGSSDNYPFDDYYREANKIPDCIKAANGYTEVPWTRIEFELRNQIAIRFLCDYFDKVLDDDSPGHFTFDYIGLYKIENEQDERYVEKGQYVYMSFSSLWNDVVDSYNLYCKEYNEYFVQFREELHEAKYSTQAVSLRWSYRLTPYRTGLRQIKSVNRAAAAFDIYKNGSRDSLKRISDMLGNADDIVTLITLLPLDFADSVTRKRLQDIADMCCISKKRATDMLNQASMKGYFDNIMRKMKKFEQDSIFEETDEIEDDFEYPREIEYVKRE